MLKMSFYKQSVLFWVVPELNLSFTAIHRY